MNKFDGRKERSEFRLVHKGVKGVHWHEHYHGMLRLSQIRECGVFSVWGSVEKSVSLKGPRTGKSELHALLLLRQTLLSYTHCGTLVQS